MEFGSCCSPGRRSTGSKCGPRRASSPAPWYSPTTAAAWTKAASIPTQPRPSLAGLTNCARRWDGNGMRHVLSALVQNQPGVLAHISGMLASRGFNIDSLAVGETETAELSRITFVVHGDDAELEQVRKQLDKVVTVVRVMDISVENFVERDLMLIKVRANP